MSIATLARKSRAQRGASTRTGWTLATTKSGNCPGPCGGGAPAKQHSFRRLMKNKARPGVEQEAHKAACCTRTQTVTGDGTQSGGLISTTDPPINHIGETWFQNQNPLASGTLIEFTENPAGGPWVAVFRMNCESDTQFTNNNTGGSAHGFRVGTDIFNALIGAGGNAQTPVDTYTGCGCCPPVATWKKTNDPKGEQSIGYYLWRKKQLTHNCIKHCIPHREHYNATCTRTQTVTGDGTQSGGLISTTDPPINHIGETWFQNQNPHTSGTLIEFTENPAGGPWVAVFRMNCEPDTQFTNNNTGGSAHGFRVGTDIFNPLIGAGGNAQTPIDTIVPAHDTGYCHGPCDNVGCKCNCNKSMGGTACCVVHKTMLPLSNSENIAWVVEDRTCLQTSKPDPRNPNTC